VYQFDNQGAYVQQNKTPQHLSAGRVSNLSVCVALATQSIPVVIRTYKYRLLPSRKQHLALTTILSSQRDLYNAALESRIDLYRKTGKSASYFSQCKELAQLRSEPDFATLPSNLQRATLKRLDVAYQAFFRRVKRGEKPGFPRFKGIGWWNSFGFTEFRGITLQSNRIRFKGIPGRLRIHIHRTMPEGKILCCQFRRDAKGWHVCFQVRIDALPLAITGKAAGIDMGLSSLVVLSSGEAIPNVRASRRHERDLRRRQRALSRCRKGSNGRRKAREAVARLHMSIRNTRHTYLHQVSARLVRENDVIKIEKLNVKGMAAGILAKSVNDAAWSTLKQMLAYKAEYAGRQLIEIDPRNTTQACSGCGVIVPKTLSDRWHDCPECGLSLDRDHNAALNILGRSGSKGSERKAEVAYA
jgi:putative transposase